MTVLLLNAGSSSLKTALVEPAQVRTVASSLTQWGGSVASYRYVAPDGKQHDEEVSWKGHADAVRRTLQDMLNVEPVALPSRGELTAVGHRIVHGGWFSTSVRVTPEIRARISALAEVAPLHNPPGLATLDAAEKELPGVPLVAVFDTAFHATLPPEAWTYPIPQAWTHEWGIRRFGFHGLSYAYCSRRAAEMLDRSPERLRLVICHLGNGCSACAVMGGRSIDTTMGFSPLEGLMMGTRSGSIDPTIPLYVQQNHGLSAQQVEQSLNHESGLLGVSGISSDMRRVLEGARTGHQGAQTAVAVYTRRVRQAVGALTVTMGGMDALVFTGGVGEHANEIRESVCEGLECLGLEIDQAANATCKPDADVATGGSRGRILVITAREDVTMLREVLGVLADRSEGFEGGLADAQEVGRRFERARGMKGKEG
jgi:acetate kinase